MACRTPRGKRELIRVVRTPDGEVAIDPSGRRPGRGAYLCRDAACWDLAGRKKALEHALKATIPEGLVASLAGETAAAPATIDNTHSVHGAITGSPDATTLNHQEGGPHGSK